MKPLSNFLQRTLTGALFVLLILGSVFWNYYAFAAVILLFLVLGVWEFHKLMQAKANTSVFLMLSLSVSLFLAAFAFSSDIPVMNSVFRICLLIFVLLLMGVFIAELYRKQENPLSNIAYTLLSVMYVGLPFAVLMPLYATDFRLVLALFLMIWANDTFAYLTGMMFGKHRLFERISPKKSWEGSIGGAVFTMLVAYLFSCYVPIFGLWAWLGFALIIVVFGTFGDLVESMFKRSLNVKDSGNILPGHGGILDRFDSLLLAAPAILVYLLILINISLIKI